MSNTDPYTTRIKSIASNKGVELSDEQSLEVLVRLAEMLRTINETEKESYGNK